MRYGLVFLVAVGGVALAGQLPGSHETGAVPPGLVVDTLASDLEVPWAIGFTPDDRILVSERPGAVRVVTRSGLVTTPWLELQVATIPGGEAGLMGLAVDPDFERTRQVFLCFTSFGSTGRPVNRVVAYRDVGGRGVEPRVVLDDIPGGTYHNGCSLGFGPDGMLYVTTGDAYDESLPQDVSSPAGKILRIDPAGRVPRSNPYPESPVWSYGHRNSQGFAWHGETGEMFATEHGTGGVNELNRIAVGLNYGWPVERVGDAVHGYEAPLMLLPNPPAGIAFLEPGLVDDDEAGFVVASLGTGSLDWFCACETRGGDIVLRNVLGAEYGRLRAVAVGSDDALYVTTSNRDRRGDSTIGGDWLLRVRPPTAADP